MATCDECNREFSLGYNPQLIELVQTCWACPSQWSGKTADDEEVYIRYRWGTLRVDVDGVTVYEETIGDDLSGILTEEEMLQHTGLLAPGSLVQ